MLEVYVGGMSAWVEPSCQLSYILLPCDRWQQRGSLTEKCLTWKRIMKQRCVSEFPHVEKMAHIDSHQHLLNVSGNQTVDVSTVRWCISAAEIATVGHLHCCRLLPAWHAGCSWWVKMWCWWWWLCLKIAFCSWESTLSKGVIVFLVSVVVSMQINWRHYYRNNLHIWSNT